MGQLLCWHLASTLGLGRPVKLWVTPRLPVQKCHSETSRGSTSTQLSGMTAAQVPISSTR